MAWRRSGNKPLSEPRMGSLLTHICVTRPQRVKQNFGSNVDMWINIQQLAHTKFNFKMSFINGGQFVSALLCYPKIPEYLMLRDLPTILSATSTLMKSKLITIYFAE